MTLTVKLPPKAAPAVSITSNSSLTQKSSTRQNPAFVNTKNPAKQLDFAFDNNSEKTNNIVMTSNIQKH